jgi:hypothetical protein
MDPNESISVKFNLHAVYALAHADFPGEDQFSHPLPFQIAEGVALEDVSPLISPHSFDMVRLRMGTDATEKLEGIHYALVHRFEPRDRYDGQKKELITQEMQDRDSAQLVFVLTNCLRLIRPTREEAQSVHGNVRADGTLDVMGFAHPVNLMEVPDNQKLFAIRNEDIDKLAALAPSFIADMYGEYWRFRMAVQFYELGHYQQYTPPARYLLWMSAIEALYTTRAEQGSAVAKERIKWFLGENTAVYPKGEISDLAPDPRITVGDMLDGLYNMRSYIAHGERRPDYYFTQTMREGLGERINLAAALTEGASFIIRKSLVKIVRENLIENFRGPEQTAAFFGANHLSKKDLRTFRKPPG